MSGGYWNYKNDALAYEIFGYEISTGCGQEGPQYESNLRLAVKQNPMGDAEVSALVFDVLCLLNAYDLAKSGDTDYEWYRKHLESFKQRWFKMPRAEQIRRIIEIAVSNLKEDLCETFALDLPAGPKE